MTTPADDPPPAADAPPDLAASDFAIVPPALRAARQRIDAIDHEILDLLARRNEAVAEVARTKRDTGTPIRDHARERALLADRGGRGRTRGLSPEVVESLFRVVLWASRDRQAILGAETPPDLEQRRVAVIGGRGGMGAMLARLFEGFDQEVLVADLDTELTPEAAARAADVVLLSVPIDVTEEVARALGPHVGERGLMLDVTSTKTGPVAAMLASSAGEVIGTHPLFGPRVHSLQGQRIALVPARVHEGSANERWLRAILAARGLVVVDTDAETHDRAMGVVQVLTHFTTEVMGLALARLGVPVEETLRFTSPVYLLELIMAARHFAQSPELYGAIQAGSPERKRVHETVAGAVADLQAALAAHAAGARDASGATDFTRLFAETRAAFGDFSEAALEQSSFLIDRLVERA